MNFNQGMCQKGRGDPDFGVMVFVAVVSTSAMCSFQVSPPCFLSSLNCYAAASCSQRSFDGYLSITPKMLLNDD